MYLTFVQYQGFGGKLTEPEFNNLEFIAETKVDWYTFNRLRGETTLPEQLPRVMFVIIDELTKQRQAEAVGPVIVNGEPVNVASRSNDGVSETYSTARLTDLTDKSEKTIRETIQTTLRGVMNSLGRELLYRGLYPGE